MDLVVSLLIVAALVAFALGQYAATRARAQDREAMVAARTAQVALILRHQREQDYRATAADLAAIEPALRGAEDLRVSGDDRTFKVSVASRAGDRGGERFAIALRGDGTVARTCENRRLGGWLAEGTW